MQDYEIIVIDDASTDGTAVAIKSYVNSYIVDNKNYPPLNVVLLRHEMNKRQGGAAQYGPCGSQG